MISTCTYVYYRFDPGKFIMGLEAYPQATPSFNVVMLSHITTPTCSCCGRVLHLGNSEQVKVQD